LGDLAHLTWRALDLQGGTVAFTTTKTRRRMILPLAQPLVDYLTTLEANDSPDAALFPTAASVSSIGTLSNRFYDLLADAGLVPPRTHQKRAAGRSAARQTGGLSFHCLRHTATTLLKSAGVSDALAGKSSVTKVRR
jgi:integrase